MMAQEYETARISDLVNSLRNRRAQGALMQASGCPAWRIRMTAPAPAPNPAGAVFFSQRKGPF